MEVSFGNILGISKAVWSTAYVNSLPDAAFAYIEPGGEKDDEGKTKPRSLRHLPHHNDTVVNPNEKESVDLPHLRNALARVSQMDVSDAAKEKALKHLKMHAKQLGVGEFADETTQNSVSKNDSFWNGVL